MNKFKLGISEKSIESAHNFDWLNAKTRKINMFPLIQRWRKLIGLEREEDLLLGAARVQLISGLLLFGALIGALFFLRDLFQGTSDFWFTLSAIFLELSLWVWLKIHPGHYHWIARLLLLGSLFFTVNPPSFWHPGYLAPSLVFLPLLSFFTLLLEGPRAGIFMMLLQMVIFCVYLFRVPSQNLPETVMRSNLFISMVGIFGLAWAAWRQFRTLTETFEQNSGALKKLNEDCHGILKTVLEVLETQMERLEGLLGDTESPDRTAISEQIRAMSVSLESLMGAPGASYEAELLPATEELLDRTRLHLAHVFTNIPLVLYTLVILRNSFYVPGQILYAIPVYLALGLFKLYLIKRNRWSETVPRLLLIVLYLSFFPGFLYWGRLQPAPGLVCFPILILAAALLELKGLRLGTAGAALYLTVLGWFELSPASLTHDQSQFLFDLIMLAPVVLAGGWAFWRLRHHLLEELTNQDESFRRSLRIRRRLLGTLLHDFRNPLLVLQLSSEDERPLDSISLRRMVHRMGDVLKNSRELLDVDGPAAIERLRPWEWWKAATNIQELFGSRLARKRMTLKVQGYPDLKILCLPGVLCDSILANLVSNALKFSPKGSTLELSCSLEGEWAVVRLDDQGPGMAKTLLEAFRKGQRLPSSAGNDGEVGTGLGLLLARDYARFMGGDLELRSRDIGGLRAILRLKAYR